MGIRADKVIHVGEELYEFLTKNNIKIGRCCFLDLFPMVIKQRLASPITINNLKYILLWKDNTNLEIFNEDIEVYPSDDVRDIIFLERDLSLQMKKIVDNIESTFHRRDITIHTISYTARSVPYTTIVIDKMLGCDLIDPLYVSLAYNDDILVNKYLSGVDPRVYLIRNYICIPKDSNRYMLYGDKLRSIIVQRLFLIIEVYCSISVDISKYVVNRRILYSI